MKNGVLFELNVLIKHEHGHRDTHTNTLAPTIYDTVSATAVQTLSCSDLDGDTLTYAIASGDDGTNKFTIPSVNVGVIKTSANALDCETKSNYVLVVTVVDSGSVHTATATVYVQACRQEATANVIIIWSGSRGEGWGGGGCGGGGAGGEGGRRCLNPAPNALLPVSPTQTFCGCRFKIMIDIFCEYLRRTPFLLFGPYTSSSPLSTIKRPLLFTVYGSAPDYQYCT